MSSINAPRYRVTAITAHGFTENWVPMTAREIINLALDLHHQWLLDHEMNPDSLNLDQAFEALTHDYRSHEIEELK